MNALNVIFDKALKEDVVYAYYVPSTSPVLLVRSYTNKDEGTNVLVTAPDILNSWIEQGFKLVNHLSGMRKTLVFGSIPLSVLADTLEEIKPHAVGAESTLAYVSFNINGIIHDPKADNLTGQPIQVIMHIAFDESTPIHFEPSFKAADGTAIEDLGSVNVSGEIRVWFMGYNEQEAGE